MQIAKFCSWWNNVWNIYVNIINNIMSFNFPWTPNSPFLPLLSINDLAASLHGEVMCSQDFQILTVKSTSVHAATRGFPSLLLLRNLNNSQNWRLIIPLALRIWCLSSRFPRHIYVLDTSQLGWGPASEGGPGARSSLFPGFALSSSSWLLLPRSRELVDHLLPMLLSPWVLHWLQPFPGLPTPTSPPFLTWILDRIRHGFDNVLSQMQVKKKKLTLLPSF